jgi:glycosyltransferase involved in cell wall biosynthesis
MRISATIITFNEEQNIEAALESLAWADEIIIVDSQSTDRTVEIARRFTDRIFIRAWPGYSAQKNFAAEQARYDWVFNLDADERVSPELAREIESLKNGPEPDAAGFEIPRATFYLGRWIKHSGWHPDFKLRLYNRNAGRWRGNFVHESVEVNGRVARLRGEILHYSVGNASEHHQRIDRYTTLAALESYSRSERPRFVSLMLAPMAAFIRSYFFKLGFLDGTAGLAIAYFAAYYVFLKKLKLWEISRGQSR